MTMSPHRIDGGGSWHPRGAVYELVRQKWTGDGRLN